MSPGVAAVIVTYNSAAHLDHCLESLASLAEIVVVDNASADGTCRVALKAAKRVRLILNRENRGFAAAANQGIAGSASPLMLFLNPDAALEGSIQPLVDALGEPGVGAAAGRLIDESGRTQVGFNLRRFPTVASLAFEALLINRLWPGNPVNRRFRCLDLDHSRGQDVEQPAGAFLMARRDVLESIGLWDERFFPLWFEDVDLCQRIRRAGYKIRYVPSCVARHRGAHSVATISVEQKQIYWYRSLLSYTEKYFSPRARVVLRAGVFVGALLRMLWALGKGEPCRAYGKVMVLALGRQTAQAQVQPHALT